MSKTVWIVAGPNGAGKSTLVARHNKTGFPVSNPDDIARDLCPASPETVAFQAGKLAVTQRKSLLQEGRSFIVETTFSGANTSGLIDEAHACGFKVRIAFVAVSAPTVSMLRVQTRVRVGGHNVPTKDILRRYERSFSNFLKALEKTERAYVIDNSRLRPIVVARFHKGRLQRVQSIVPEWLLTRIPQIGHRME